MQLRSLVPVLFCCALVVVAGCGRPDAPQDESSVVIGAWPAGLRDWLDLAEGQSHWRWNDADGESGRAQLDVTARSWRWQLSGSVSDGPVTLTPADPTWLSIGIADLADLATTPPLSRLPIDSDGYPDLVALVRDLITPRFEGKVPHWPAWPVPVQAGAATSGVIDLTACLREAVASWNDRISPPPFTWDEGASWGIRLAHYGGSNRTPPMEFRITRTDSLGRPLRARIAVGDDYSQPHERIYAVRGLAHELGHALLLWGHSPDREHLLWGAAPPLRKTPSKDEQRAVQLLRLLPRGLDLGRYGPANGS